MPADHVIDLPPGLFHVFARHSEEGFASGDSDFTVYRGEPEPETGYRALEIPLHRAGVVDFGSVAVAEGNHPAVWLMSSEDSLGTLLPLVPGERQVQVPAGRSFVTVIVRNGFPASFGSVRTVEAGEALIHRDEDRIATGLVVPVQFAPGKGVGLAADAPAPDVWVEADGRRYEPMGDLSPPQRWNRDLMFFELPSESSGRAVLRLEGDTWQSVSKPFTYDSGEIKVLTEPVYLEPLSELRLTWDSSGSPNFDAIDESTDCDSPELLVRLVRCERLGVCGSTSDVEPERVTVSDGDVAFTRVEPGEYRVTVWDSADEERSKTLDVSLEPGGIVTRDLDFFVLSGRVLDAPADGRHRIRFDAGEAITSETGDYTALLWSRPMIESVRIEPCEMDGPAWLAWIDRPLESGDIYDFNFPGTAEVRILDESGDPIVGATLRVYAFVETTIREIGHWFRADQVSDAEGVISVAGLGEGKAAVFELSAAGFKNLKTDRILIKPSQTFRLERADVIRGRIASYLPGLSGYLFWHDQEGNRIEFAEVSSDGTFELKMEHGPSEIATYVSPTHPLVIWVQGPGDLPREDLILAVPEVSPRTVVVDYQSQDAEPKVLGLFVGNVPVPTDALTTFMDFRGEDIIVSPGATVSISGVIASVPLAVAAAPIVSDSGRIARTFFLPEFFAIERVPVPAGNRVTLR